MSRHWLWALVFCASASANSAEHVVGDARFADTIAVSSQAAPFVYSGAASLKKNFIDYYAIALYVPYGASERQTLIDALAPLKLRLVWTTPALSSKSVQAYWRQAFTDAAADPNRLKRIGSRIDAFVKLFDEIKFGDVTELEYDPDLGMKVFHNGRHGGNFAGVEFNRALIQIWLGNHATASPMRSALLTGVR
jgi:hypothetical protein